MRAALRITFGILLVLTLYLLPWGVALLRRTPSGPTAVVNVLLGWTLIGWAVALAMALGKKGVST